MQYIYCMSVNLQFAKLEYAYIRNVTVVPYIYTYIYTYTTYCAHCCTVYVGLAQARPNNMRKSEGACAPSIPSPPKMMPVYTHVHVCESYTCALS